MNKSGIVMLGSLGFAFGCVTVPDDAPQAFHDAESSIERMQEMDVEETLPKTAENAEDAFGDALNLLDDARDQDPDASEAPAIAKAREAKMLADNATRLHEEILSWDADRGEFNRALAMLDEAARPIADTQVAEPISPFAKLDGSEFTSTVAFFDTDSTSLDLVNKDELQALVNVLKKDQSFEVALIGHADSRGDEQYNRQLAQRRAEGVAKYLRSQGVAESQVKVSSAGEGEAMKREGAASMQLDRKVRAVLTL